MHVLGTLSLCDWTAFRCSRGAHSNEWATIVESHKFGARCVSGLASWRVHVLMAYEWVETASTVQN